MQLISDTDTADVVSAEYCVGGHWTYCLDMPCYVVWCDPVGTQPAESAERGVVVAVAALGFVELVDLWCDTDPFVEEVVSSVHRQGVSAQLVLVAGACWGAFVGVPQSFIAEHLLC